MAPYALDPANAAAAHEPVALARQVYSSTMSGEPTAFLLCHPTLGFESGDDPGRLSLVHSISRYDARIGRPAFPWDDEAFETQGDVVMGSVSCFRWLADYMRQTSGHRTSIPSRRRLVSQMLRHPRGRRGGRYGRHTG